MFFSFSFSASVTVPAFEKRMLTITSAFISLASRTSKRILVPDCRLSRWTCRTRCQNDVRSAKIGYYITCGSVSFSTQAFYHISLPSPNGLSFCRISALQLLWCPVSLFNVWVCYFVICQLVTVCGSLSGHLFCYYFPFFFFRGVSNQRRPWFPHSWGF